MKYFFLGVCLVMVISVAFADPHHTGTIINTVENHYYTEKGIALGAALGSNTFDRQENRWQSAISASHIDESAIAIHAGKRLCNGCFLGLSIGKEGDKTGGVVTYNWTW